MSDKQLDFSVGQSVCAGSVRQRLTEFPVRDSTRKGEQNIPAGLHLQLPLLTSTFQD